MRTKDILFSPKATNNGITNFKSGKFYLALACYLISLAAFLKDPFFNNDIGEFSYKQTGIILLIGFIIMASLHWDIMLFGRPAGANLWLQVLSIAPFVLFCSRIFGKSTITMSEKSWFAEAVDIIKSSIHQAFNISIPEWVEEIFIHWEFTLLFIVLLLFLCLRNTKIKISGIILLLAVPFLMTAIKERNTFHFWLGSVSMIFGLILQFSNYAKAIYYMNVLELIKPSTTIDKVHLKIIMRIMDKINSNDKILENEVIAIVQNEYNNNPDITITDIKNIASNILKNMMDQFNLISLKLTSTGIVGACNPRLYHRDNMLTYIAVLPRVVIIIVITVFFILSPIDLIPDITPVVGTLDDVSMTIFSFLITKNSMEAYREK